MSTKRLASKMQPPSFSHDHKNSVSCVQWNRNGNWLLSGSRDHVVKLYDIRMLREFQSFRGHKKEITCKWRRTRGRSLAKSVAASFQLSLGIQCTRDFLCPAATTARSAIGLFTTKKRSRSSRARTIKRFGRSSGTRLATFSPPAPTIITRNSGREIGQATRLKTFSVSCQAHTALPPPQLPPPRQHQHRPSRGPPPLPTLRRLNQRPQARPLTRAATMAKWRLYKMIRLDCQAWASTRTSSRR